MLSHAEPRRPERAAAAELAMKLKHDLLPISKVSLGIRRRRKLGNLKSLLRSIKLHGLIHPIVVARDGQLVVGARRLEACKQLGWHRIPVLWREELSDEEFRAIELDENIERLDLEGYEKSKRRLAEIRQGEADSRKALLAQTRAKTPRGGRPKKGASRRDVAVETGIGRMTQQRVERHVELAEDYPFMQREGWVQYRVLEAGAKIEGLPKQEHAGVAPNFGGLSYPELARLLAEE